MPEDIERQLNILKSEMADLRFILSRKTGLGSADIKGKIVSPSSIEGTVDTTTDQTINGVKTFGSIPVLPASNPTTDNQAARKKYVDDNIAGAFTSRARVYRGGTVQSIPASNWTKVQFNAENYDGDNEFDSTTNYRFTAGSNGYYAIISSLRLESMADGNELSLRFAKNGAEVSVKTKRVGGAAHLSVEHTDILYLAANDYIEVEVYQSNASSRNLTATSAWSFLSIHRLS